MIRNNRPYTNENGWVDDNLITDIKEKEQEIVFNWIYENIIPRKTELKTRTSYGIKHLLQKNTGIYLTNNQFKDAMMHCGYMPVNPNELNWTYRISKKSKAFKTIA
ncbi:hypothetical protein [Mycoplasma sp. CSL7503-lung]|uniref:hypothetical protein n=1 Tax=Mycoplasma sp. CSL7503-lung TaxID=536372 RepID=UPI0021CFAD0A|nr:hypothetical protein [Mycoplasma sp. CSL7503-lung]MCU4706453.1 hypothetical protein [Mycoplasma sp. CSL7503-lung]